MEWTSDNVFVDDLNAQRTLETTYYVTDSKQVTDFFWYRESGTRLNVGLQDIDIVAVYDEVPHDSDSEFVLGNQALKFDRQHFLDIQRQYCRSSIISAVYAVTVYLSVCPSQVGVLQKRLNVGLRKQRHTISPRTLVY